MKLLFICKHNRFRSRVALAYFNKINKNKKIKAESSGILEGFLPLDKNQVRIAKEFGLNILGKPRATSMELLKKQDLVIVIANDIPRAIFSYKWYKDKIQIWKIKDVAEGSDTKGNRRIIQSVIKKVDILNKQLGNKK